MLIWSRNTFLWPTYDQIELVTEAPSHLVYHDQSVILVIEVELFHDQHIFRHRSVFLLGPSQMVMKLVTEGDATWHGPCWLLTWQGACWHGYDDVSLWHSATCRVAVCPRVELWMVHVGLSTCRAAVCPRVIFGWATFSFLVGPRVWFRLRHVVASKCTTCLFPVSLSIHIQFTGDRNFCIYNIFIWHKAYNRRHKHVLDSQDNHVHRRHNHVHRRHNHVHRRHIRLSRTQDKFRSDSSTSLQVPAKQNFQEEADPSKIPWQPAIIKV
jgi:hypothetical protein